MWYLVPFTHLILSCSTKNFILSSKFGSSPVIRMRISKQPIKAWSPDQCGEANSLCKLCGSKMKLYPITGLDCGLDCWTGSLDLICSYHLTSTQSEVLNLLTLTALHCFKLHFIIPLHGRECTLVKLHVPWVHVVHIVSSQHPLAACKQHVEVVLIK